MEVRDFLCDPSVKVQAEVPIFTPQQTTTLDLDIRIYTELSWNENGCKPNLIVTLKKLKIQIMYLWFSWQDVIEYKLLMKGTCKCSSLKS